MLILTQIPYIPHGTLFDCCAFPREVEEVSIERIRNALDFLGLIPLTRRNDEEWQTGLSPGERQRLALTRIFVHEPRFLLMDEATSAIPQSLEYRLFEWIRQRRMAVISIAHHRSLEDFHDYSLVLNGRGSYQFNGNERDDQ
jgi:ABC-type uncharacterized transport system fused permease/ATPase subunit